MSVTFYKIYMGTNTDYMTFKGVNIRWKTGWGWEWWGRRMTYIATPDELIHCCFTKEANIGAPAYKLRIKKKVMWCFKQFFSDLKHEKITARALKDAHFSVGTVWNQLDLADLYSMQRVKKHAGKITVKSILCSGWEGLCCSQPPGAQDLFWRIDELSHHC